MSEAATEPQPTSPGRNAPTAASVAAAIARRAVSAAPEDVDEVRFAKERDVRLEFRRLVDPGIARGTSKPQFDATLNMLSTIAENLLKDPENEKFRRFKPTNGLIKKNLVEVKGAVEYAVAMGFRAEVEHFQPYYKFIASPKNWDNLRIGASVLKETVDKIKLKEEQDRLNRVDPKAVQREIAMKVKLAYEDDRKEKKRRDEIERQAREARAANRGAAPSTASLSSAPRSLSGRPVEEDPNQEFHTQDNGDDDEEEDQDDDDEMHVEIPSHPHILLRGAPTLTGRGSGHPPPYSSLQTDQTDPNEDESTHSN